MSNPLSHAFALLGALAAIWLVVRARRDDPALRPPDGFMLPDTANAMLAAGGVWLILRFSLSYVRIEPPFALLAVSMVNVVAAVVVLRAARARPSWPLAATWRLLGLGIVGGFVTFFVTSYALGNGLTALYQALGNALPELPLVEAARVVGGSELVVLSVTAVLMAPLAEEVFFRGVLLPALSQALPLWLANLAQAVLFGAIHVTARPDLWVLALPLAVVGWLLGVAYARTGSLRVVVAMHATFNGISLLLLRTGA